MSSIPQDWAPPRVSPRPSDRYAVSLRLPRAFHAMPLRTHPEPASITPPPRNAEGRKSYVATLLLAYLFGMLGADRFYLGKFGTGLLKLVTFGGYGVWWLADVAVTLFGGQRDSRGRRLAGYAKHKRAVWLIAGAIAAVFVVIDIAVLQALSAAGAGGLATFGAVLLVMAGLVGAGSLAFSASRRRFDDRAERARQDAEPVPPRVSDRIRQLDELGRLYAARGRRGDRTAASVASDIGSLATNAEALFHRLWVKGEPMQRGVAASEYDIKLGKLAAALGRDHLLDVLVNPHLWEDPAQRVSEVQRAVAAVDAELVANIRKVNAHRAMVFQVVLDGMLGPNQAMEDWQREFDKASGAA